jgi:hypothetical protein
MDSEVELATVHARKIAQRAHIESIAHNPITEAHEHISNCRHCSIYSRNPCLEGVRLLGLAQAENRRRLAFPRL